MSSKHVPADDFEDQFEDEELVQPVFIEQGWGSFVTVDGVPVVEDAARLERLTNVLKKILGQMGEVKDLVLPAEPSGKTKGFAFVEFAKPEHAALAVAKLNGYALDKNHKFVVNKFADLDVLDKVPENYKEPEVPAEPKNMENMYDWLLDPLGRDEYLTFTDVATEVFRHGVGGGKTDVVAKKTEWTEKYFMWSPHGTYLVTLHQNGVFLWGGPEFKLIRKFPHHNVDLVDFSPCEKYIVTFSARPMEQNPEEQIIFWDVRSGQRLRGFPRISKEWPAFRWSHDDKYFARLHQGVISVFETPSMKLLDSKSVKLHGPITDFQWSPGDNILAAWVPEAANIPSRVVLVRLPDRKEIAMKNLFNVVDCKLHWQSAGEYLCVKVDRVKSKKQTFTSFELFRLTEKNVPVEPVEFEDFVLAFAWEPKGHRFAIIHAEQPNTPRPNVSFYTMGKNKVKHIVTLEKRPANYLFWSPAGRFIVLAGLRNLNGTLEFYNVQDKETMGTVEHDMATNIEWDPTGRYVTTYVSQWSEMLENGFMIWSFNSEKLASEMKSKLFQFLWRPRPPTLLSKEQEKDIQGKFKEYSEKYKREDAETRAKAKAEKDKQRKEMRGELDKVMAARIKDWEAGREARFALTGVPDEPTVDDFITIEQVVEEVLEVTEEVVPDNE